WSGDGQLEGVVWCKLARDEAALRLIHDSPIPIVAMNAPAPEDPTSAVFVSCDNEGGIELAVDHLWQLGHRRILFVREREEVTSPDQMARAEAFRAALARRGAPSDVETWQWYGQEFPAWYAAKPPHTAIIGWSERCAGMVLNQAEKNGVNIPERLSVIGFDSTRYCETTRPRLTAVCQPVREMARHATQTLLDLIQGCRPETHSFVFPCTLDVRDSTAPNSLPR
ncbi:LacI family transcriptional regulator, partial [bacterium]